MKLMGARELDALDRLLEYVADEARDFKESDGGRQRGHIFNDIHTLAKWRGHQVDSWPDPIPMPKPRVPSESV